MISKNLLVAALFALVPNTYLLLCILPQQQGKKEVLSFLAMPFCFLTIPLLYLCLVYRFKPERKFKKVDLLHVLLPLLTSCILALLDLSKTVSLTVVYAIYMLQFFIYLIFQKQLIAGYPKIWLFLRKDKLMVLINVTTFLFFAGCFCVFLHLCSLDRKVLNWSGTPFMVQMVLTIVGIAFFCFYLSYYTNEIFPHALSVAEDQVKEILLKPQEEERMPGKETVVEDRGSLPSLPTDLSLEECCRRLEQYMREEKPWLHKRITLQTTATNLNFSTHLLSALINKVYKVNYNDFINQYRIQYIKEMVTTEASWKDYTLEAIAIAAGFASRTACYNAFMKSTGMSLGNYIEKLLAEQKLENGIVLNSNSEQVSCSEL